MNETHSSKLLPIIGTLIGVPVLFLALLAGAAEAGDIAQATAGIGVVAILVGVCAGAIRRERQQQSHERWSKTAAQIVRTETIEHLGHTSGGLSAPQQAQAGQLSTSAAGQLSPARSEREPSS